MGRSWTDEQKKVIETRGSSLLVSAAAGSGKTAVLVERILREILNPVRPVDLDRLLIVTFTRAASGDKPAPGADPGRCDRSVRGGARQ